MSLGLLQTLGSSLASVRDAFDDVTFWGAMASAVLALGVMNAIHAIMNVRLYQSAIAWTVFLVSMPWVAIPAYWIFGRRKFEGYTRSFKAAKRRFEGGAGAVRDVLRGHITELPPGLRPLGLSATKLAVIPFTRGNAARLLVDAEETYPAMLGAIAQAREYVLFQVYILNDDTCGRRFLEVLAERARAGVRVHLLYDEIGSRLLTRRYLREAKASGIDCSGFKTTRGRGNRFQLNFRNHRKILVVDGCVGFVGGLNVGDEQLGCDPALGAWRDTHARLEGPVVASLQFSFLADWHWATDCIPEVSWDRCLASASAEPSSDAVALSLSTGPADDIDACSLFVGTAIDLAREKIWIATPYFVPDESTLSALKIASLRGVDVRILVPRRPDHLVTSLCAVSFYDELAQVGVKVFCYPEGFMHQKVVLVDDTLAGVGTVNLDNRSFHLNFEVMAYVVDAAFVGRVKRMLEADFAKSPAVDLGVYFKKGVGFRVAVRLARLISAVL